MSDKPKCPPCKEPATACDTVVEKSVCVTAKVVVTPKVRCKKPTVICVGPPRIVKHGENPCPDGKLSPDGCCKTTVAQTLLVRVPVEFAACVECEEGDVFCLPPKANHQAERRIAWPVEPPKPSRFLYTRSADFYQHQLFPANFADDDLCRAVQAVAVHSLFLGNLLSGYGAPAPGEPCPVLLPLSCLTRLEALLTPTSAVIAVQERYPDAPPVLGLTARQLLTTLLNASLSANTPLGLVGGLSLACTIDLSHLPGAAELLGERSTVGALVAETEAALMALDARRANVLEPALAAVNTDGSPSVMLVHP